MIRDDCGSSIMVAWASGALAALSGTITQADAKAALAIAAGTQSAETGETPAQSEGCQSGAKAHRPNSVGHLLHKRSD